MSSHLPYRKGVGAVLLDRRGRVFVGKRIDMPSKYWQMPQGGIDKGEKPKHAVIRELAEETGITKAEIIAKSSSWLTYDLPAELVGKVWKGKYRGQKQRWFALRFTGKDKEIDLEATDHPEFMKWKWVSMDRLASIIVPFKRKLYQDIVAEFSHLPNRISS